MHEAPKWMQERECKPSSNVCFGEYFGWLSLEGASSNIRNVSVVPALEKSSGLAGAGYLELACITHTHTHIYICIYIYLYKCGCVCACVYTCIHCSLFLQSVFCLLLPFMHGIWCFLLLHLYSLILHLIPFVLHFDIIYHCNKHKRCYNRSLSLSVQY